MAFETEGRAFDGADPIPPALFSVKGAEYVVASFGDEGPGSLINETSVAWATRGLLSYMTQVAGLVWPDRPIHPSDQQSLAFLIHQRNAFIQSPSVLCTAFEESQLNEELANEALAQVTNPSQIPGYLIHASPEELVVRMNQDAADSLTRHPEVNRLFAATEQYYAEAYQHPCIGHAALFGMGFVLSRLDEGWVSARAKMFPGEALAPSQAVDDKKWQEMVAQLQND